MSTPFQTHERLTAIALAVRPRGFIADLVLPRVSVGAEDFKYAKGRPQETHTIPDTRVGRRSRPNQVEFGADLVSASTQDHALDDPVPIKDIEKARAQMSSWDHAGGSLHQHGGAVVAGARTARVEPGDDGGRPMRRRNAHDAGRKPASGATRTAIRSRRWPKRWTRAWCGPNIMVIGQEAWTGLRRHPKIVEATKMTGAGSEAAGMATKRAVAELFEIDEVIVGQAFYSSAKKGPGRGLCAALGQALRAHPPQYGHRRRRERHPDLRLHGRVDAARDADGDRRSFRHHGLGNRAGARMHPGT